MMKIKIKTGLKAPVWMTLKTKKVKGDTEHRKTKQASIASTKTKASYMPISPKGMAIPKSTGKSAMPKGVAAYMRMRNGK